MLFGYVGYLEAESLVSLWAGLASGGILVLSALGMFAQQSLGIYVSLAMTFLLTAMFSYRYAVTAKNVPAMLAIFSGGMLLFLLARFGKWKTGA